METLINLLYSPLTMINKESFANIRKELENSDDQREITIQLSRDIIKESKVIIYSIQRGDKPSLDNIKKQISKLERNSNTGIENTAVQEYVEAVAFYDYIFHKKLSTKKEMGVDSESYLLGLCDLTGELVRKAVKSAIEKDYKTVLEITKFVEDLYGEFLQFNLRNGELRKKSDSIKWNLQKLEGLSLEVSKN
mgnify:CR=1 FL=1